MPLLHSLRQLLRPRKPVHPFPLRSLCARTKATYEVIGLLPPGHHAERWLRVREHSWRGVGRQLVLQELERQRPVRNPLAPGWHLRELRPALRLVHPNIPRVHDLLESEPSVHQMELYALMDEVPTDCLYTASQCALDTHHCFSEAFALYVGGEVASALHYAHTLTDTQGRPAGLLHGGLQPACIRLGAHGEVRLINLVSHPLLARASHTRRLMDPCALGFIRAPERRGQQPVDGRLDLFHLGAVMLELLAPQGFRWPRPEVDAVAPHVPEPTRALLRRLLRTDPAERHPTAEALRGELHARLAAVAPRYSGPQAAEELLEMKTRAERLWAQHPARAHALNLRS